MKRRELFISVGAVSIVGCLGNSEQIEDMPRPILGNSDNVLEVFADFACSHCATFHAEVFPDLYQNLIREGELEYHHYDFPLTGTPSWSESAASAARAAQDYDENKFWEFIEWIYPNQDQYGLELVEEISNRIHIDPEPIVDAADNNTYNPVIMDDRSHGIDIGVEGTPTVILNGQVVRPSYSSIESALR